MALANKNIVVGIGGGIAAYKTPALVRELRRRGAQVRVVMTSAAQHFIGATTFTGLTGAPAVTDLWNPNYAGEVHVELSDWADAIVVAPATHNLMARLAAGIADDTVLTTLSCANCPILLAPAMHTRMWTSPANTRNTAQLKHDGLVFVGPEDGPLANGQHGLGRMAEPEAIADALARRVFPAQDFAGKTVLISAGPTQEELDPVRFISNRSTGKMGFAIAEAARDRGARVILVAGPTTLPTPAGVNLHRVQTAVEMKTAIDKCADNAEESIAAIVMTAAVADYRPKAVADQKIKKSGDVMTVEMVKNPDILEGLGLRRTGKRPVLVGFAMETQDVAAYARRKLERKKADLIVGNEASVGFGGSENEAVFVTADGDEPLPRMSKRELGDRIWDRVLTMLQSTPD